MASTRSLNCNKESSRFKNRGSMTFGIRVRTRLLARLLGRLLERLLLV